MLSSANNMAAETTDSNPISFNIIIIVIIIIFIIIIVDMIETAQNGVSGNIF